MVTHNGTIGKKFFGKKIVIVGDLVADQFLRGTIARVSREAPVFILRHDETETLAGGAANAAVNVASLGGNAVLVGLVGKDLNGNALLEKLRQADVDCSFVIAAEKYQTTTKIRVLAGQHYAPRQQVIRIDYENRELIVDELQNKLKHNLFSAVRDADAIIVSDYNYGVANALIAEINEKIAERNRVPVLVDSRFNLKNFTGATTATPNQEEVEQILGENFTEADCVELCKNLGFESLLVTRGNKGMLLIEKNRTPVSFEAVGAKEPVDVTGAGDTVIAAYALGLASGLSFSDAANVANHAGGIVVMKKGTAAVSFDELLASLEKTEKAKQKAKATR
ncbi:MAG TPA: PfkB family carbohydrate kinase [Pyrinomonadaceae bacterium]|nr:PfkB family carbohydrate kinase [Pyrinomonadaceae bacterium]